MKTLIVMFSIVSTSLSFAATLQCAEDAPRGVLFKLVTDQHLEDSKYAVFIGKDDVEHFYTPLYASHSVEQLKGATTFKFGEAAPTQWSKIDPDKQCFVQRGNWLHLFELKEVAGKKYEGTYWALPRIEVHPERPSCPLPPPALKRPIKVTCESVRPL